MKRAPIIISLVIIAGAAVLLGLSTLPSGFTLALKFVRSVPLGDTNESDFKMVKLSFSNGYSDKLVLDSSDDIQAKVGGRWIEVDQVFQGGVMDAGGKIQRSLCLPGGADVCRIRFLYGLYGNKDYTWMSRSLRKLGPVAVGLAKKSSWLRNRVWPDESNPFKKEITIEMKIPQRASAPDKLSHSTPN